MFGTARDAAGLLDRACAATRAENQCAGQRLAAISELDLLRLRECGENETWCSDTHRAISVEIGAALRISISWASSYLDYARAMRNRLPKVGKLLRDGEISYATFQTIVYRTDLITDPKVLAAVDAELANRARRWPSMTAGRCGGYVDKVVALADRDAVRQRRETQPGREFSIWDSVPGLSEVSGTLTRTDAHAVDARLDALADTVCPKDPRTRTERRADAMGAMAFGAERLACRCGQPGCPAGGKPAATPVLVHIIAEQASVDGTGDKPGSLIGADALIPAEMIADLAGSARLQPLIPPIDCLPENGYCPSKSLATFIRCRDLTCRFPGCDKPAIDCDIDHTTPYHDGGATHASNLKCLCRDHHLSKTFWGWHDRQLPDGTVIWTAPDGRTYVTTPGSALLFPTLMTPTGQLHQHPPGRRCTDRIAMMPKRRRTRAQNHAQYVAGERRRNRNEREARRHAACTGPAPPQPDPDDDPPPF